MSANLPDPRRSGVVARRDANFRHWTGGWLDLIRGQWLESVQRAYLDMLEGRVDAGTAQLLSL